MDEVTTASRRATIAAAVAPVVSAVIATAVPLAVVGSGPQLVGLLPGVLMVAIMLALAWGLMRRVSPWVRPFAGSVYLVYGIASLVLTGLMMRTLLVLSSDVEAAPPIGLAAGTALAVLGSCALAQIASGLVVLVHPLVREYVAPGGAETRAASA